MILKIVIALLLVGALMGGVVWRFGGRLVQRLIKGLWRPGAATLGLMAMVGGMVLGVKGLWPEAAVLLVVGAGLGLGARNRGAGAARPMRAPSETQMSPAVAAALLGVDVNADRETVRSAYRRLIKIGHPDAGGTQGLAAQLGEAQAVLLARIDGRK